MLILVINIVARGLVPCSTPPPTLLVYGRGLSALTWVMYSVLHIYLNPYAGSSLHCSGYHLTHASTRRLVLVCTCHVVGRCRLYTKVFRGSKCGLFGILPPDRGVVYFWQLTIE